MSDSHEGSAARPIEALPSYWRGVLFRSRIEARWAVFFDAIGLHWDYEPEGFRLPDGAWYLPDFWLPEMKVWAEVKPGYGPDDDEVKKASGLVAGTKKPLVFLAGSPRHDSYSVLWWEEHDGEGKVVEWGAHFSKRYTMDRRDGNPRMFVCDNGDPGEDPWIQSAAETARAMDVKEPDAGKVLPVGWEGIDVPL